MKTVTFVVEFTTKLPEGTNPNDICFRIDPGATPPYSISTDEQVGHTTGYTTVSHWDDELVD